MRVMSFQKCRQSFDSDGFQPQSDRLPVAIQLSRNRTHGEPLCVSSAATMMRVRVSMFRAYSGLSDFYGDNARSCCLWNSLARCSGVSD
jgi:hypothetical protein